MVSLQFNLSNLHNFLFFCKQISIILIALVFIQWSKVKVLECFNNFHHIDFMNLQCQQFLFFILPSTVCHCLHVSTNDSCISCNSLFFNSSYYRIFFLNRFLLNNVNDTFLLHHDNLCIKLYCSLLFVQLLQVLYNHLCSFFRFQSFLNAVKLHFWFYPI